MRAFGADVKRFFERKRALDDHFQRSHADVALQGSQRIPVSRKRPDQKH